MHNKPNHQPDNLRPTAPRSDAAGIATSVNAHAARWAAQHEAPSITPADYLRRCERLLAALPLFTLQSPSGGEVGRG